MHSTTQAQLEWMRTNNFAEAKIRHDVRTAKIGPVRFMPGPFGIFAGVKRAAFWLLDFVEDNRHAATVPSGLVQMGNEEYLVGQ